MVNMKRAAVIAAADAVTNFGKSMRKKMEGGSTMAKVQAAETESVLTYTTETITGLQNGGFYEQNVRKRKTAD